MTETIDMVKLVENNPLNKLNNNDNSMILNKIKEKFPAYEQQLFVANFYCYLNYNTNKDYVVDLDNVWKWIGFERKGKAKELLVNNFKENEDYIAEKAASLCGEARLRHEGGFSPSGEKPSKVFASPSGEAKIDEETRGGSNKETILMTIKCFKKLCMKTKTKKSDEIHEYYITLEEMINELVYEQSEQLKNQLIKKCVENERSLIINFENKHVVYLIQVEDNIDKFGYAKDIKTRLSQHKTEFGKDIKLKLVFETMYNREFETMIKKDNIISPNIIKKKYKNLQTELVKYSDTFTSDMMIDRLEELKKSLNGDLLLNLMNENTKLRQELDLKSKIVPIYTNPDNRHIFIEINENGKDLYKISSTVNKIKDTNIKFVYNSVNTPQIIDFVKLLLRPYDQDVNEWINITYKKLKGVLDFAIMVYDMYHIGNSVEELGFFIGRYNSNRLINANKARVTIERPIYEQFVKECLIVDITNTNMRSTCIMVCEEFYMWYKNTIDKNSDSDLSHIRTELGNWSISFREELVTVIKEITGAKYGHINLVSKELGLNHAKNSGFIGISLKNLKKKEYYKKSLYIQYISEFITVNNEPRYKLARKEILDDFTLYVKEKGLYNPETYKTVYCPGFIKELIKNIEEITGSKFVANKTKKSHPGLFEGLDHKNFDCKMHETPPSEINVGEVRKSRRLLKARP